MVDPCITGRQVDVVPQVLLDAAAAMIQVVIGDGGKEPRLCSVYLDAP
jgi:hypothetical protein